MEDTICAISTPNGVGGISIIRVSGPEAIEIVNSIFKGKDLRKVKSHTINYGYISYKGKTIDEVLVSVMLAPRTYTCEDVVEINMHGGLATTNKILQILLERGCRLAEPGEFTKRAFLNGRIDLVEAEAVSDVINAENETARNMSLNNLTGSLSTLIKEERDKLLELEANIEVNIDYPEYEDIEEATNEKVLTSLRSIEKKFKKLIEESNTGKIIKNGIDAVIIGRPNVGKSSILNALLEENKAIVTDIEGTTRDVIEGKMVMDGILINFIDTAGIRDTENVVEKIGVDKSLEKLENADLVILVLNRNEMLTREDEELLERVKGKNHIIFVNKNDLPRKLNLKSKNCIEGNTLNEDGLDALKEEIKRLFSLEKLYKKDLTYISNARQLALLEKSCQAVRSAIENLEDGNPVDLAEIDISNSRKYLSEILGEEYEEELIDELFSKFCLGK